MASIHKQPRRAYWFASYRDATGKQHFTSTRIRHAPLGHTLQERAKNAATNRRLALDIAMRLEEAERGNATEAHLRKLLSDVSERVNQRRLEFKAADTFLNDWLERARKTKAVGTHERYRTIVENFLKSLEAKAKAKISDITVQDVQKFIEDRLKKGRNPSTVRTDCKILNAPFALALRQGLCLTNPVAASEIPEGAKESRTPFTSEQVSQLLKGCTDLAVAPVEDEDKNKKPVAWDEWKTCIMIGFYTGVRLGDAVLIKRGSFDFKRHVLNIRPQKTSRKKRDLVIPVHPQLEEHVLGLGLKEEDAMLCPSLAQRTVSGKHGLSIQFHRILSKAKIKQQTVEAKEGGNDFHKFTFHSLRHSFVSEMANAGIAPDVRQLLAGHSEERSHAVYTHTTIDSLRRAINVLPKLALADAG